MIRYEFHEPQSITVHQFEAINNLISASRRELDHDVIMHDDGQIVHLWVHFKDGRNPVRHHINATGGVFLTEEVTWDWMGVTR